jgi:hypothetical protein
MSQQEYEVVLSPELDITPEEFADAWNELAEARERGQARTTAVRGTTFDPTLVITVLISVTTGVASNVIADLIMKVLEKRGSRGKHTHIEQVTKPDGTQRLVADIDE